MHTDNETGRIDSTQNPVRGEEHEDQNLQWLIERDLDEPRETLFAVHDEEAPTTELSAFESALAGRPMFGSVGGSDDLTAFVGEEILMSSQESSSDIYDDPTAQGNGSGQDSGGNWGMAVDHTRAADDGYSVDELDFADGSDILGLEDDDTMGEKFLVLKRNKKVAKQVGKSAAPTPLAEAAAPSGQLDADSPNGAPQADGASLLKAPAEDQLQPVQTTIQKAAAQEPKATVDDTPIKPAFKNDSQDLPPLDFESPFADSQDAPEAEVGKADAESDSVSSAVDAFDESLSLALAGDDVDATDSTGEIEEIELTVEAQSATTDDSEAEELSALADEAEAPEALEDIMSLDLIDIISLEREDASGEEADEASELQALGDSMEDIELPDVDLDAIVQLQPTEEESEKGKEEAVEDTGVDSVDAQSDDSLDAVSDDTTLDAVETEEVDAFADDELEGLSESLEAITESLTAQDEDEEGALADLDNIEFEVPTELVAEEDSAEDELDLWADVEFEQSALPAAEVSDIEVASLDVDEPAVEVPVALSLTGEFAEQEANDSELNAFELSTEELTGDNSMTAATDEAEQATALDSVAEAHFDDTQVDEALEDVVSESTSTGDITGSEANVLSEIVSDVALSFDEEPVDTDDTNGEIIDLVERSDNQIGHIELVEEGSPVADSDSLNDYVASYTGGKDDEDFDAFLVEGEHLGDIEVDAAELAVEQAGEDTVDPEPDSSIEYHEDFVALGNDHVSVLATLAPRVDPLMDELQVLVNSKLEAQQMAPDAVTIEPMLALDDETLSQCRTEGYHALPDVAPTSLAALEGLAWSAVTAIQLRLRYADGTDASQLLLGVAQAADEVEAAVEDVAAEDVLALETVEALDDATIEASLDAFDDDNAGVDLAADWGDDLAVDKVPDVERAAVEFDLIEQADAAPQDDTHATEQETEFELAADEPNDELVSAQSVNEETTEAHVFEIDLSADNDENPEVAATTPDAEESSFEVIAEPAEEAAADTVALVDVFDDELLDGDIDAALEADLEAAGDIDDVFSGLTDDSADPIGAELLAAGEEEAQEAAASVVFDDDLFEQDLSDELLHAGDVSDSDVDALFDSLTGDSADADDLYTLASIEAEDRDTEVVSAEAPRAHQEPQTDMSWCLPAGINFSEAGDASGEIFEEFLEAFIDEAASELEKLESSIDQWELDVESDEAYAPVTRILHTLKGIAKGVGLQRFGTYIHNFETLLEGMPRPAAGAHADYFRIVHAWLDAAVHGYEQIGETRNDLDHVVPGGAGKTAAESAADAKPEAANDAEAPEAQPRDAERQAQRDKMLADEGAKALAAQQTVRITSDRLDALLNLSNQAQQLGVRSAQSIIRSKNAGIELDARLTSVRSHIAKIADRALQTVTATGSETGTHLDALEMDQYSELQEAANILREAVEDLSDLISLSSRHNGMVETLLKQQSAVMSSLGASLQAARVIPVSRLMPGLRRIVRTVSTDLGKSVAFKVLGEVGSLDRDNYARCQIILEHMVRNALDHGIESPEDRLVAGKPTAGRITVNVHKEGADYFITLADDGRGIDPDQMREVAYEKALDVDLDNLSDADAQRLIFHKGFSTATTVSEISGRGVGMDVVLSELQAVGGDIEIQSTVGQGTSFRIRIPSNVTVNGALMVSAGETAYAIPLDGLIAVEQLDVDAFYDAVESGGRIELLGHECEPAYLATLCSGDALPERGSWGPSLPVIIAGSESRYMAIAVDDVTQALELVIRTLGSQFSNVPGLAGAATTADGDAIVALDLNALVASVAQDLSVVAVDAKRNEHMLVLVVDDSRTQRMVATSQFDTVGVETITAENGMVAIDLLNTTHRLPDVVLLDVEMPVKDGIQTLREIRKSSRFRHLPVIMVTSRTGAKHRALAEEAGCNGYMGKPFNFPELVAQINALTGHDLQLG